MTKFKQGLRFRHDNTLDTDIHVISVDADNWDSTTLTVMWVTRVEVKPLYQEQITIKVADADKWKRVIGGVS
jgi:hypothetical protein